MRLLSLSDNPVEKHVHASMTNPLLAVIACCDHDAAMHACSNPLLAVIACCDHDAAMHACSNHKDWQGLTLLLHLHLPDFAPVEDLNGHLVPCEDMLCNFHLQTITTSGRHCTYMPIQRAAPEERLGCCLLLGRLFSTFPKEPMPSVLPSR